MAIVTPTIKRIQLSDGEHEIDAKYWDGHLWSDISQFRFVLAKDIDPRIVDKTTLEQYVPPNEANYQIYKTSIVLVDHTPNPPDGLFDEYALIRSGSEGSFTYRWEEIGTTGVDLDGAAKAGTYTSSQVAGYTATVSGSITYSKSDTNTGEVQPSFTGTTATLTSTGTFAPAGTISKVSASNHSHPVNIATDTLIYVDGVSGTFNTGAIKSASLIADTASTPTWVVVTGVTQANSAGGHSHTVNVATASISVPNNAISAAAFSSTTGTGTSFVTSVDANTGEESTHTHPITASTTSIGSASGWDAGTLPTLKITSTNVVTTVTGKNFGFSSSTSDVMRAPTVSSSGVLSWTLTSASTQVAATTGSIGSASNWNAGALPSITISTKTLVSTVTVTGAGGAHKHSIGSGSTKYVIKGTAASNTNITYVTGATTSSAGAHTHGIANTTSGIKISTEAAGTAAVTKTTASITYVTGATTGGAGAFNVTPTFYGTTGNVTVTTSYKPAGTIASHSHSITLTDATATFSLKAPIAAHSHTVTVDELYSTGS